jgi:integrase
MKQRLTATAVKHLKAPGSHLDGKGLYLQITDRGSKSWIFRFKDASGQTKSGSRYMGLGTYPEVSLDAARNAPAPAWSARRCREVLAAGHDPIAERERERAERVANAGRIPTFAEVVAEYLPLKSKQLTNAKNAAQWKTTLTEDAKALGPRPVDQIETADVIACLAPIWVTKNETARRVLGRVREVLDYSRVAHKHPAQNPARDSRAVFAALKAQFPQTKKKPKRKSHAALPWSRTGAFVADSRARKGTAARCLEFCILTAARTNEAIGARWSEIDFKAGTWTVPGSRMKSELLHTVPLTADTLAVLESQLGHDDVYVFPGDVSDSHLSNGAMAELVKEMHDKAYKGDGVGYVDPKQGGRRVTVHGMRSTFKDWYRNCAAMKYSDDASELALAHVNSDETRAAYARDELLAERTLLMAGWAKWCNTLPVTAGSTPNA